MDSPVASTDQGLGGRTISFEELYNLSYLVFGEHWFHSRITCWTYSTWSAKGGRLLMLQTKTSWNITIFFFQGNLTSSSYQTIVFIKSGQASLQVAQNTTDIRLASLPRLKRRKYEWWNWWEIDLTLVWRVRVTLYCAQNLSAKMFGHNVGGEMLGGLHQWQNQPHACLLLWCICAQCATRLSTSLKIPMHTSGHHVWRAQFSLRQPLRLLTYTSVLSGFAMMRNQF